MVLHIKEIKDNNGAFSTPLNFFWWLVKYVCIPFSFPWIIYRFICNMRLQTQMARLQNKVVVITGASSGIGEALAHSFYAQGCRLVLASRRVDELNRVKADLMRLHPTIPTHPPVVLQLDLADLNSLSGHVTKILEIFGRIDILINNGGISFRGSAATTNVDVDIKIMLVNYFAQIALTKAVIKNMIERKSGHLVYMSSVQGKLSLPYRSAYGASKHAIQSFADALRSEVTKHNIKVTIISPAYVNTSLSLNALTETGGKYGHMDERTKNGISAEVVAMKTLEAVVQEKKDVVISSYLPKFVIALRGTIPSLYEYAMLIREKSSTPKT